MRVSEKHSRFASKKKTFPPIQRPFDMNRVYADVLLDYLYLNHFQSSPIYYLY